MLEGTKENNVLDWILVILTVGFFWLVGEKGDEGEVVVRLLSLGLSR